MKNLILSLFAVLSVNAFATSPVLPKPGSLAELHMGGGMPTPGGLAFRQLWITISGEVFVYEGYHPKDFKTGEGRITREFLLGTVEAKDLIALKEDATKITLGPLGKARGPECMDAPGYSYMLPSASGLFRIYTRYNCQDAQLKNKSQRPAALAIKQYLDQWNSIR